MYEESGSSFDPNSMQQGLNVDVPNYTPSLTMQQEHSYQQTPFQEDAAAATHFIQELVYDPSSQSNWNHNVHDVQNMGPNSCPVSSTPYCLQPQVLGNLFYSPRWPNATSSMGSSAFYDPLSDLSLSPNAFNSAGLRTGALFGRLDERNGDGGHNFDEEVLEFTGDDVNYMAKGRRNGKGSKHNNPTERQRRIDFKDKYEVLKSLLPNSTKGDRASIVGDAMEYIKELLRTVDKFKILVEEKRCSRVRIKVSKTEEVDHAFDNTVSGLRSSLVQRKSRNSEVDVRVIDNELTIKIFQQKKIINCLLLVSKFLNEIGLDLQHVAGGLIGDYYSFFISTKICEGSCVYPSAIANKLIEVLDTEYTGIPQAN
ncbi:hypothetical protein RJ639_029947 [Escallonia herrerae]|uniref:BHLH domain-containing protein n=1 Tax=Escallonia herrerae TaxID=1293975 RepID=A0AA89BNH2_9ASTE|nr:hypothetical protein RJ639_029947 [Escallonia herrerae]